MKKLIILLFTLLLIALVSILLLVPMINYVMTFEDWYSFMTLNKAIAIVAILIVTLVSSVIGIIFLVINIKKYKSKNRINVL